MQRPDFGISFLPLLAPAVYQGLTISLTPYVQEWVALQFSDACVYIVPARGLNIERNWGI